MAVGDGSSAWTQWLAQTGAALHLMRALIDGQDVTTVPLPRSPGTDPPAGMAEDVALLRAEAATVEQELRMALDTARARRDAALRWA